jgi:hypothetical protein
VIDMPLPKWRMAVIVLVGVLLSTGVALLADRSVTSTASASTPTATATTTVPTSSGPVAATQLARSGVQATWVVQENQQPGTTNWRIAGAPANGFIEGFADQTYATTGQPVNLFVSTSAPAFHVEAYRVGYYGGTGGRLVWASPTFQGQAQPQCQFAGGVNMVSCANWTASVTVQVTQYFVQGDYLLKLVGSDNEQSYVPLTVWDPASTAAYLVKNDVFTWQAWNPYGGYDYYQGVGNCPPNVYPLCSRARIVSFDRPYDYGQGAGDFLALEAPLVRFAEQHGLDVTYVTDMTVEDHPGILAHHRALLSLGHDECWSLAERDAVTTATSAGMNIAFFGAGAVLRHVRTQSSPLGPDRQLIDYRDAQADPLNGKGDPQQVTGNTWSAAPARLPPGPLVGESYNGFLKPGVHAGMTIVDPAAWIFQGTGLTKGSILPSAIASDVDSLEGGLAHPSDVQVLAHSALPANQATVNTHNGSVFYSDMTYYTSPTSKAGVWDSGTTNWIPALTGSPAVGGVTGNLLWLFGQGPAGRAHPSVASFRAFYPG